VTGESVRKIIPGFGVIGEIGSRVAGVVVVAGRKLPSAIVGRAVNGASVGLSCGAEDPKTIPDGCG